MTTWQFPNVNIYDQIFLQGIDPLGNNPGFDHSFPTPQSITTQTFYEETVNNFNIHPITGDKYFEINGAFCDENLMPLPQQTFFSSPDKAALAAFYDEQKYHFTDQTDFCFSNQTLPSYSEPNPNLIAKVLRPHFQAIEQEFTNFGNSLPFQNLLPTVNGPKLSGSEARELLKKLGQNIVIGQNIQAHPYRECLGHKVIDGKQFISKTRRKDARDCVNNILNSYDKNPDFKNCETSIEGANENAKKLKVYVTAFHPNDFQGCDHCELKFRDSKKDVTLSEYLDQKESQWTKEGLDPTSMWNDYAQAPSLLAKNSSKISEKLIENEKTREALIKTKEAISEHLNMMAANNSYDQYPYGDFVKKVKSSPAKVTCEEAANFLEQICQDVKTQDIRFEKIKKCLGHYTHVDTFENSEKEKRELRKFSHSEIDEHKNTAGVDPSSVFSKTVTTKKEKKKMHELCICYKHVDNNSNCGMFQNVDKPITTQRGIKPELNTLKDAMNQYGLDSTKETAYLAQNILGPNLSFEEPQSIENNSLNSFAQAIEDHKHLAIYKQNHALYPEGSSERLSENYLAKNFKGPAKGAVNKLAYFTGDLLCKAKDAGILANYIEKGSTSYHEELTSLMNFLNQPPAIGVPPPAIPGVRTAQAIALTYFALAAKNPQALLKEVKILNNICNKDLALATGGIGGWVAGAAINKIKEMPFPDRELPQDKYGNPIPNTPDPHTQLGQHQGSKEKYPKAREFGNDGEHIRDIEFTDHCRPQDHPLPHQHKRKDNPSGGTKERGEPEPVPEWNYGEE